jgi:uncharacterized membrane protein YeaQ/YmgE (transglycosylase-associated protein family)
MEKIMLNLLGWIIVGGLAGWIASIIAGRNRQQGCVMNIVVGVIGAALGGLLYNIITGQGFNFSFSSFNISSLGGFLVALVGAVVLLLIVNIFQRK